VASASVRVDEARAQNLGFRVIAILGVLTIIEYLVAINVDSSQVLVLFLTPVALVKAWLILQYFMHASKLWRGEGAH
jgi:heme/copper-type cytochrome/quinol oxidase subunit 4